jgi:hypothetical protein
MNEKLQPNEIADTVRSVFNFEVQKQRLSWNDDEYLRSYGTPLMGLFRDDTGAFVGDRSVSERFEPHTSEDVIALAESTAYAFDNEVQLRCDWVQNQSNRDGHYVTMSPPDEYRKSVFGTEDNVFPRVVIRAAYGSSFKATMGYFRDACSNLAMLQSTDISTSVTIRHTKSLREKMDDLIDVMSGLKQKWHNLTTVIDHMANREVRLRDFLTEVYAPPKPDATDRQFKAYKRKMDALWNRVARERYHTGRGSVPVNGMVTAWEAYNAVQGYSQHDKTRRSNATRFDRILLTANDRDVLKAEQLALAL